MVLGAALLAGGLLQTTSAHFNTDSCPGSSVLVAKFNRTGNSYVFEKPSGNQNVVTITNGNDNGGNWTSQLGITATAVKGGSNTKVTSLNPAQTSGTFNNTGLPPSWNPPDISHVEFCGPTAVVTTTTTMPPTTTTTAPPTTTTTAPPTTTTTAPSTTTTTAATTTTTTVPSTTTTVTEGTTTTTAAATTTTTIGTGSTTTTGASGSTTTAASGTTTTTSTSQTGSAGAVVTSTTIVKSGSASAAADPGSLPNTGGQSVPLITAGLVFLCAGLALTLLALKRRRTA